MSTEKSLFATVCIKPNCKNCFVELSDSLTSHWCSSLDNSVVSHRKIYIEPESYSDLFGTSYRSLMIDQPFLIHKFYYWLGFAIFEIFEILNLYDLSD